MKKITALPVALACLFSFNNVHSQFVIRADSGVVTAPTGMVVTNGYKYEPIVIQHSASPSGVFNSGMIFVAEQLDRNVKPEARALSTLVTSFADLNNLGESSAFGRMVGEHLMHELQLRGWGVSDVRLSRELIVNDAGEFSLSRDIKRLRESFPAANVVTGTYTSTIDGILLSVRVIDMSTGALVSSAQTRFSRDRFMASLVDKPHPMAVVKLTR